MLVSPTSMRFALLPVCLTLACATSPSRPSTTVDANGFTDSAKSAAAAIRAEAIAGHIRFLADDLLAGRDPGTHGYGRNGQAYRLGARRNGHGRGLQRHR